MPITPLSQIINLPEKCPLQEIQGVVSAVYELVTNEAGKTRQNLAIKDSSGLVVKATAWSHDDLSFYKGKDVIIKSGPKGGLTVNNYQGKPGVSISGTCTFQTVAGGQAPQAPAAANSSRSAAPANTNTAPAARPAVQGQTIGMAINNACNSLTSQGLPLTKESIWKLASVIVSVAQAMEAGKIHEATPAAPAPAPAPAPEPEPEPQEEAPADDIPF